MQYSQAPQVIKDVKRMLKQADIRNNIDLDQAIKKINKILSNRISNDVLQDR